MVYSSPIDYATTYFTHHPLNIIHGEPTYDTLKKLKKQLKSNAQAVPSTLGGGDNGLLGLVLTPAEYASVNATPFVIPVRPPPLTITPLTPTHDVIRLQQVHERSMDTFMDCQAVEKLLKKQIIHTVKSDYLQDITDDDTDRIILSISGILTHLFETYGEVEPEELAAEETKMASYYWDLNEATAIMYNKIDDLQNYATAAGMPKTDAQLVNIGLTLIRKTNDFEKGLTAWYNRHHTLQTYRDFKIHFTAAKKELQKVRGKRMKQTSFHQVNQVAQLQTDLSTMRDELVSSINTLAEARNAELVVAETLLGQNTPPPPPEPTTHPIPFTTPSAYATSTTNDEVLQLLRQMQQQMSFQQDQTSNVRSSRNDMGRGFGRGNRSRGRGGGRETHGNPRYRARRNTNHYCWTHGACAHDSAHCNYPDPGHQIDATLDNKKGGNTYYCD